MEAIVAPVQDMPEVDLVIAAQAREPNSGLVVIPDSFTVGHRAEITALAARYRVPAIYWSAAAKPDQACDIPPMVPRRPG